jgi:transcriptional regulator
MALSKRTKKRLRGIFPQCPTFDHQKQGFDHCNNTGRLYNEYTLSSEVNQMKHEVTSMQTKRALAASLKSIMAHKPFSKITVTEIIDDCGVNRKTFYYHFENIYALLHWMLEQESVEILKHFNLSDRLSRRSLFCHGLHRIQQTHHQLALWIQEEETNCTDFSLRTLWGSQIPFFEVWRKNTGKNSLTNTAASWRNSTVKQS